MTARFGDEYTLLFQTTPAVEPDANKTAGRGLIHRVAYAGIVGLAQDDTVALWKIQAQTQRPRYWDPASSLSIPGGAGAGVSVQVGDAGDDDRFLAASAALASAAQPALFLSAGAGAHYGFTADTDIVMKLTAANPTDLIAATAMLKTAQFLS